MPSSKTNSTSVRGRAALSRRHRRTNVDDRATGRKRARKPEVSPDAVPTSPQNHPDHDERGRPPSPFKD